MADEGRISIRVDDGVADVRLARPDKLNAIDGPMMDAIVDVQGQITADRSIRAVVLSGDGRGFCSGLDMSSFAEMATGELTSESDQVTDATIQLSPTGAARPQLIGWGWYELPQPVIAALHGPVIGAGLHVALGTDVRYVTPDVKMAFVETEWGLVPDLSPIQSLRRIARLDVIKELILTSREVGGEEAVRLGLATRCSDTAFDDAMATARTIAAKSPDAIRAAKRLANDSGLVPLADGLALELQTSLDLMGTPNQIEAVVARMEGRPPLFDEDE